MKPINTDTEEEIKKAKRRALMVLSLFPLSFLTLLAYGIYWAFFDMNHLPKQELLTAVDSPDGAYTVKAYLSNGGATTAYAVLGELHFNKVNKKPKPIYFNYREEHAKVEWIGPDTVVINGHTLHVPDQTFDYRRN
ncbi:DUF5412 domain-containing protein [Desulforamulus ruminis]|uniref:DUF5412 domain-containing protein n=1 Tax=Desulforamulus ruminis TaxID=1564 RepID=UPI002FD9C4D6